MLFIKHNNISNRLSAGFGTVVFFTVLLGLTSILAIIKLTTLTTDIYEHPFTVSRAIGDINSGVFAIHRTMKDVLLTAGKQQLDEKDQSISVFEKDVYRAFDVVGERFLGDKAEVSATRKVFANWMLECRNVIALMRDGKTEQAAEISRVQLSAHVDNISLAIGKMRDFANNKAASFFKVSQTTFRITFLAVCIMVLLAILTGAVVAALITRSITIPLSIVVEGIRKIRGGDLDYTIGLTRSDEIGILAGAFDNMVERLKVTTTSRDELDVINKHLETEINTSKMIAEELAAERERLSITLNSIGDGVISTDNLGRVVTLNPISERLTGWTQRQAKGKPLDDVFNIINCKTRKRVENPVAKVLETGKVVGMANHTVLVSKDGTEYQIADSASPICNSKGDTFGVVLVFRDVTGEYEQNRILFEQIEKQKLAADAGGMGMWDWDIENGIMVVDDNWKKITNRQGESNQIPIEEIFANVHSDDISKARMAFYGCITDDSDSCDALFRFGMGTNDWLWLRVVGRVVGWNTKGNADRMVGIVQDITERRNLELLLAHEKEGLRTTLNSIGDAVIATDIEGRITRINPVAQRLTGWNQWEAQGRMLEDVFCIVNADTGLKSENLVSRVLETPISTGVGNNIILIGRGGQQYHISDSAAPIKDKEERVNGIVIVFKDITKEFTQQKAFIEQSQYLKLAIDASGVGLWSWDILTGRFTVDDNWVKMFKWKDGKSFHINNAIVNVHKDDLGDVRKGIDDCLCGKNEDYDVIFRFMFDDGQCMWARSLGRVMQRDSKGNPVKFMGVNIDVTDIKRSQIDLLHEKENIRITLNSIGDGVIATDTHGCVVRLNPVSEKLTGWTEQDAKGRPLDDVFKIINVKTRKKADDPVQRVLKTGSIVGLANHTALISRDGTEYQIADSAAPIIDSHGNISGVVLVFRDVTQDYKQKQLLFEETERRRLAVDAAKIGIWDWDVVTDKMIVDEGWIKMLNWKGHSVITATEILTVVNPDDVEDVKKAMEICTSGKSKDFGCVFRFLLPDGIKWIRTLGRAVEVGEKGIPTRILGMNQDITDLKSFELKYKGGKDSNNS